MSCVWMLWAVSELEYVWDVSWLVFVEEYSFFQGPLCVVEETSGLGTLVGLYCASSYLQVRMLSKSVVST